MAPFFMFQVICLILWSLDDYWYYSVMTLVLLMFFESMQCKQRLNSLQMLRNMRQPACPIYVLRNKQWYIESTFNLLPGDIISLTSNSTAASRPKLFLTPSQKKEAADEATGTLNKKKKFEPLVPCDVLLLKGSCIVNEAMLTGESIPQTKESISSYAADRQARLDIDLDREAEMEVGTSGEECDMDTDACVKGKKVMSKASDPADWKRNIVYGGTTVVLQQHSAPTKSGSNQAGESDFVSQIPIAPDGGAVGMVLRTGYGTTQGGLMRKILFSTDRINAYSMETVYFIIILVLVATISASIVVYYCYNDPERDQWKLLLHCIMIITAVVPPELPMQLSLSVTNSLASLSRALIFCTEPFRIPYAGKLSVLCFDKTGTLTTDKLLLKGIVSPIMEPEDGATTTSDGQPLFSFKNFANNVPYVIKASGSSSNGDGSCGSAVDLAAEGGTTIYAPESCSDITLSIMSSCHSIMDLSSVGKGIVGDPMELVTLEHSGFSIMEQNTVFSEEKNSRVKTFFRYPFNSTVKRMSVIVHMMPLKGTSSSGAIPTSGPNSNLYFLFVKGAPEILASRIINLPKHYHTTYTYHMSRGKRVIAMGYRPMYIGVGMTTWKELITKPRDEVEQDLIFAGFIVYDSDLKPDTKAVIKELNQSNHHVVVITGDSVYTATDICRKIGVIGKVNSKSSGSTTPSSVLILHSETEQTESTPKLVWKNIESLVVGDYSKSKPEQVFEDIPFDEDSLSTLAAGNKLCISGNALDSLLILKVKNGMTSSNSDRIDYFARVCRYITVYARVAPLQKEFIIRCYNRSGQFTLMCGDGTNDVGALKAAHVGVSVINDAEFETNVEDSIAPVNANGNAAASAAKRRVDRAMAELQAQQQDATVVKLGDASIASPFTARRTSIDVVLTLIKQGRCTLVTTIHVYKILALNCLTSAFSMSFLYLKGLKQGDTQMTVFGIMIAGLFFMISQSKPLPNLSEMKPPSSVFELSVILSILGQCITHVLCLYITSVLCDSYKYMGAGPEVALGTVSGSEEVFYPNIINTATFLVASTIQINNFVVNYSGHPFVQSLSENVMLYRAVLVMYAVLIVLVGGQIEPINDLFQLINFNFIRSGNETIESVSGAPAEFQGFLFAIMLSSVLLGYFIEHGCRNLQK